MKYLILKLNNQTHALKDRDTICASLNDYMTVEAIKSNIGEESEIDIRANGNLLIPGRTILMSIPITSNFAAQSKSQNFTFS